MILKNTYNSLENKGKSAIADAEKYIGRFLAEIPDLAVTKEKPSPAEGVRPDFHIELRRGDQRAILLIEAKPVAEPRIVADWMARLPNAQDAAKRAIHDGPIVSHAWPSPQPSSSFSYSLSGHRPRFTWVMKRHVLLRPAHPSL